jgi:hypothetical protein
MKTAYRGDARSVMNQGRATSGGGINSNKKKSVEHIGGESHKRLAGHRGSLGHAVDAKEVTRVYEGRAPQPPLGNEVAKNVGAGGPGAGRTMYRSGSQGTHGGVHPGEHNLDVADTKSTRGARGKALG